MHITNSDNLSTKQMVVQLSAIQVCTLLKSHLKIHEELFVNDSSFNLLRS